ncbi:MAG: hypothetical protein U0163_15635 [Gemmatimonadaceae bacterium]
MTNPALADVSPASPNTDAHDAFEVTVTLQDGYAFTVDPGIDGAAGFAIDETPPLGEGRGPNPARVLASAMASCLRPPPVLPAESTRRAEWTPGDRPGSHGARRAETCESAGSPSGSSLDSPPTRTCPAWNAASRCSRTSAPTESVRRGVPVEVEVVPSTASA